MEDEVKDIDYSKLRGEVARLLKRAKHMVLATSANNQVTARTMSCASDDLTIYCQTDKSFTKCKQMAENPNVALCAGNMQIEGTASIQGHPLSDENKRFVTLFKKRHSGSFKMYSHLEDEVVIEIEPTKVTLWKYDMLKKRSYRDFLNIADQRAYRQFNASV